MNVQDLIDTLFPNTSLSKLLIEVLLLEARLSQKGGQSEYFKWGRGNHQNRLNKLRNDYHHFQENFNQCGLDDLIRELIQKHEYLEDTIPNIQSRLIRIIAQTSINRDIERIKELIQLKMIIREISDKREL